jgi:hypothetical protein
MRKLVKAGVVLSAFAVGWVVCAATFQDQKIVFADSAKAEFKPAPAPGASMSLIWGDMDKGPFGAFVKFEPGAKFDNHSHSSSLRLAVLKGAYLYKGANGKEHRVGPGCFLSTPGGDHHWSGGDDKEGALFYMESNGKFDLIPDKK